MAKVEPRKLSREKRQALENELRTSLLHLSEKEQVVQFFCDMLTPSERIMLARRIQVAKRLLAGKSLLEIRAELGVGFPLILSTEKLLEGAPELPTTSTPLEKHHKQHKGRKKGFGDPSSFTGLRRRYGAKMGLINFLLDA